MMLLFGIVRKNQRFEDRQTINQEMFGIYSAMRNGFDVINANANKNAFDLYKYSRQSECSYNDFPTLY